MLAEMALLSHVFTKAIEWGVVEENPCREIYLVDLSPLSGGVRRPLLLRDGANSRRPMVTAVSQELPMGALPTRSRCVAGPDRRARHPVDL